VELSLLRSAAGRAAGVLAVYPLLMPRVQPSVHEFDKADIVGVIELLPSIPFACPVDGIVVFLPLVLVLLEEPFQVARNHDGLFYSGGVAVGDPLAINDEHCPAAHVRLVIAHLPVCPLVLGILIHLSV